MPEIRQLEQVLTSAGDDIGGFDGGGEGRRRHFDPEIEEDG